MTAEAEEGIEVEERLEDIIVGQMPAHGEWNELILRQSIRRALYYQEHGIYPARLIGPEEAQKVDGANG